MTLDHRKILEALRLGDIETKTLDAIRALLAERDELERKLDKALDTIERMAIFKHYDRSQLETLLHDSELAQGIQREHEEER